MSDTDLTSKDIAQIEGKYEDTLDQILPVMYANEEDESKYSQKVGTFETVDFKKDSLSEFLCERILTVAECECLEDENLVSFLEKEIKKHEQLRKKLESCLEDKSND